MSINESKPLIDLSDAVFVDASTSLTDTSYPNLTELLLINPSKKKEEKSKNRGKLQVDPQRDKDKEKYEISPHDLESSVINYVLTYFEKNPRVNRDQVIDNIHNELTVYGLQNNYYAHWEWTPIDDGEICLKKGDHVRILKRTNEQWWLCEATDGSGRKGYAPAVRLRPQPRSVCRCMHCVSPLVLQEGKSVLD